MKAKILIIAILSSLLIGFLLLGNFISIDYEFIASLTKTTGQDSAIVDDPCQADGITSAMQYACDESAGEHSNADIVGYVQEPIYQTTDVQETKRVVEDNQIVDNDLLGFLENLNLDNYNNDEVVDTTVYYQDNSEVPVGVVPTADVLAGYANLVVYDYYEGNITNNGERVFVDDRKYDAEQMGAQAVYINVLEPSGRLTEYQVNLNTVEDTNQFDITPPVIEADSNVVELTQEQYDKATDEELLFILQNQLNLTIMDNYDGDITKTSNYEFTRFEKGFKTNSGIQNQIELKTYDSKYNFTSMLFDVVIVEKFDVNAPVISGNESIELYDQKVNINDFDALGINAYDTIDGDITNQIQVFDDGGYIPGVVGNYEVIYVVTDSSGNISKSFEYTIHVGKTIETCQELEAIGNDLTLLYKLNNDIDCQGVEFNPIGSKFDPFVGIFDGNGHTIDNLDVIPTVDGYAGLFAYNNGLIKNVHVLNANIIGSTNVGALAAYNSGDLINVSATGNVASKGSLSVVGGLVGFNSGTINNAYFDGNVDGYLKVGGLVGESSYGSINNVYSRYYINGIDNITKISDNYAGGLIGQSQSTSISNGYSIGMVENDYYSFIGGVVGNSINDKITNFYTLIDAKATASDGLIVGNVNGTKFENLYSDILSSTELNDQEQVTIKSLNGEEFFNQIFIEPIAKTNWALGNGNYPFLKYSDVNGFGTENLMRGQMSLNYNKPDVGDVTIVPKIIGDEQKEIDILTDIDITDPYTMQLQAFDSYDDDITENIYLSSADGYKKAIAGEFKLEYLVNDVYGRVSDPFTVTLTVKDEIAPTIVGPETIEINQSETLNIYDPNVMGLVSYDQNILFTNRIKVIDTGGFVGDGNDAVGKYIVAYQVQDSSGNKSKIHNVVITVVSNVIEISTCDQLQSIGKSKDYNSQLDLELPANGNYLIVNDLDCATNNITNSKYFDSIILEDGAILDGGNHTINNIYLNDKQEFTAIFKNVSNATIKNLKIDNAIVEGGDNSAVLIGQASGDIIVDNVAIDARISGRNNTSMVIGLVDEDATVMLNKLKINGELKGVNKSGVLVGNLLGDITANLNMIELDMYQENPSSFELIGEFGPNIKIEDVIDTTEKIVESNFIKINLFYIDKDGNIIDKTGTLNSVPIESEEIDELDDDDETETINVNDDSVEDLIDPNDAYNADVVDDDPIPINE